MLPTDSPFQVIARFVFSGDFITRDMCASKRCRSCGSSGVNAAILTDSGSLRSRPRL